MLLLLGYVDRPTGKQYILSWRSLTVTILYILDPRSYPLSADISGLLAYVMDQVT